ncbi:barstar family protein [Nocardia cyriacigeorgica]|uniref:Barstar family protein n=1 Tax=Nocardia cyriacigeorgica TaxID=135487 RepID=A0A6P1DC82_9NOCA|nr:barstar family protein [Nocardia cyriacigeorgica]NEW41153.1 barstar family protein [Nocardia cyriacigeorgica]NEW45982.1 barstar family protein [Nocardia cyriacigeorgica]NEW53359.1 barstar family protein [Nocardia cyriacigeorgica]NEW58048.1 barstar family protein [Nocardia cyriacigeorgica]
MTIALSQFLTPDLSSAPVARKPAPVFGVLDVGAPEFSGVRYQAPSGYRVRELRGKKMRTVAGVLDEFAAALQFPYYFGNNKDAFDDCLRDLDDWLGSAEGYVVVVRDGGQLLADAPADRAWLASALHAGADYWAHREVVFRVVVQGEPAGLPAVGLHL